MNIELFSSVYNFQKRWCWHLSSLVEQTHKIKMRYNVAYVKNNGNPKTEDVMDYFRKKFGIVFNPVKFESKEDMLYRGLVRNKQIKKSKGSWFFFVDCDIVYSKNFFKEMTKYLNDKVDKIISAPQFSYTNIENTQKVFSEFSNFYIPDVYEKSLCLGINKTKSFNIAPGGMQIVRKQLVMEKANGRYVNPKRHGDRPLGNIGTRSDIKFRRAIDGSFKGSKIIKLPTQIHLEHYRSVDEKFNPEEQK